MYHIYEEDYCSCRTYGTPKFKDVYADFATFSAAMATSGIPLKITNESLSTLYYLLYARYGLSHIATTDTAQFAYQVASTIFMYGPTWEKRLEIQETIRNWTEDELLNGAITINNLSVNPGTAPATTAFEVLSTTNQQTATKYRKSKLDGYGYLMSLLETDVTEDFLFQFNKYFMSFVGYTEAVTETGEDEPQTKTVTPTKSTQYVQADEGYVLDTVVVNPIPDEYIIPTGTLEITQNNEYNVANYQRVSVNVPSEETPTTADITDTFETLTQYSSMSGSIYDDVTVGGDVLAVFIDGSLIPETGVSFSTYPPSNPTLYLPSGETQLVLNGSITNSQGGTEYLQDTPVSWVIHYSDSGNSAIAYSEIKAATPGPTGDWAIGTDFNGKTISYNSTYYMNGNSLYGTFYPDASEPASITINFENGYKLVISEPTYDGGSSSILLQDPASSTLETIANISTGTYNSFTFNSSTYTISSISYDGIGYGSEFSESEFWNKVTTTLDDMINIT